MEGTLTNTASVVPVVASVVTRPDPWDPSKVQFGRKINAFFLSVFLIGVGGQGLTGSLNWYIAKLHGGQDSGDLPEADAVGVSPLRNQIIHQEKGLAGSADGTPMAFKGVIVIPRGIRRMREGDQWVIVLKNTDATNTASFCIRSIFKSFG